MPRRPDSSAPCDTPCPIAGACHDFGRRPVTSVSPSRKGDGMTDQTSDERAEERVAFTEQAAAGLVRSAEIAAIVLVVLLVSPPLMILLVVVAVPLVALAAVVTVVGSVLAIPYLLASRLRGHRAHHTRIVVHRLRRLRPAG